MKSPILLLLSLAFVVASAPACVSHHRHYAIGVNAIATPPRRASRVFTIVPGDPEVSANDLQFREYATYVRRMLQSRGYEYTGEAAGATIAITLAYGIGEPHTELTIRSTPLFSGTTISPSLTGPRRTATASGVRTEVRTSTSYRRYLDIRAVDLVDFRARNEIVWLWQVEVSSRGPSEDLRTIMPYLVAAARRYVGLTTSGVVPVQYDVGATEVTSYLNHDP